MADERTVQSIQARASYLVRRYEDRLTELAERALPGPLVAGHHRYLGSHSRQCHRGSAPVTASPTD